MTTAICHLPHQYSFVSFFISRAWPPVECLCDINRHTQSVLPRGSAFVFAPQWSDTAVSSISLSAVMQHHKGQIVPPNLLAGERDCHDESSLGFSSMNK